MITILAFIIKLILGEGSVVLPAGEPAPGALKMYAIPLKSSLGSYGQDAKLIFSMKIQMKGKIMPVQWAVKKDDPKSIFNLEVPVKPAYLSIS